MGKITHRRGWGKENHVEIEPTGYVGECIMVKNWEMGNVLV